MQMMTKDKWNVLDPAVHGGLIANLSGFSKDAGIDPKWVDYSLAAFCANEAVIDWVRNFRSPKRYGLLIDNKSKWDSADLCSAITGALMRNFINARLLTQTEFIDRVKTGYGAWESCVLMPNFFMSGADVSMPDWQLSYLLDGLIMLNTHKCRVVLVTEDEKTMSKVYGPSVSKHLSMNFQKVVLKD